MINKTTPYKLFSVHIYMQAISIYDITICVGILDNFSVYSQTAS
jgi:hypothetical protein